MLPITSTLPVRDRNDVRVFASRTLKNFEFIRREKELGTDHVHLVTQLANSLLGLVVYPFEEGTVVKTINDLALPMPLTWTITRDLYDDKPAATTTVGKLLKHLRHAVAHRKLQFSGDFTQLDAVTITATNKWNKADWQASINGQDLVAFLEWLLGEMEKL